MKSRICRPADDGQALQRDPFVEAVHATHGDGTQIDLRYPDTMFNTNSFIRSAEDWGVNHAYYSPGMRNTAFWNPNTDAATQADHRDHMHIGFGNGGH